jgi:hypothetical protein
MPKITDKRDATIVKLRDDVHALHRRGMTEAAFLSAAQATIAALRADVAERDATIADAARFLNQSQPCTDDPFISSLDHSKLRHNASVAARILDRGQPRTSI